MTTETTTTAAAPKKSTKKAAKKTTKKAKKAKKATKATTASGPSNTQLEVLKVLNRRNKPMTRTQVSEALGGTFIGGKIMGHVDKKKNKKTSLVGRGLVKFAAGPNGEDDRAAHYQITAAGKKAIGK